MSPVAGIEWNKPVLAALMEKRLEGGILVGVGIVHLGLSLAGLPGWQCPIYAATGIPCPGCGLTHATMQLFHGDITSSLKIHLFAPLLVASLVLLFSGLLLNGKPRLALIGLVNEVETQTGITAILLFSLLGYWLMRIMGIIPFPDNLIQ
jgi:hypothetical protein